MDNSPPHTIPSLLLILTSLAWGCASNDHSSKETPPLSGDASTYRLDVSSHVLDAVVSPTDGALEMTGDAQSTLADGSRPDGGHLNPEDLTFFRNVEISAGRSRLLSIELPEDVLSLTLIAVGEEDVMYTIEHLEGPNGETFVTEDPVGVEITDVHRQLTPFPGPFLSPNRSASAGTGVGTLLAPNTPSVELNPGIWRFSVGALRSLNRVDTSVDVTALIKRGSDVQSAGVVSVNLFFTGARDWNAANTPNDPSFQQALTRMAAFYEAVGIRLGEVTYNDIPERYRVVDTGSDDLTASGSSLHEMFRLNQYESGVSFFFVDRIGTGQNGGFIAGLSGGTPGPVTQPNNVRNGIAVATLMFPDPDAIGHVMGHEMGHFLGLFHTQEFIPSITDQIEDTPVGEAGADNLMFPTVTNMPAYLSDGQAWVLHRNILVRRRDEAQP